MAKPKAKTLQQKLGFFDDDLTNPDHDAIMKWLHGNMDDVIADLYAFSEWKKERVKNLRESANKIVQKELKNGQSEFEGLEKEINSLKERISNSKKLANEREDLEKETIKKMIERNESSIKELKEKQDKIERKISYLEKFDGPENDLPTRNPIRVTDIEWEHTVTSQNTNKRTGYKSSKYIIGYIDMKVTFIYSKLTVEGVDFDNEEVNNKIRWSQSEKKHPNLNDLNTHDIFIEVKTKIKSLGSLFRQLRAYQEYESGDFLVVCPDESDQEIIEDQGFKFYKFSN